MLNLSMQNDGDTTPVIGGVGLPAHLVAPMFVDDDAPSDDLGRQAYWLLKLNADKVGLRFINLIWR